MQDGNKSGAGGSIERVGVRVPPFYQTKPSLWFATLESQFAIANITQDATKYHYAISHLEPHIAELVEDIIEAPSASDKYERLKTELTKRLTASREKQVQQLLNHEELGERKPSQFLRHLKNLAGPGVPDEFIRSVWSSRLPSNVQTIVASQAAKSTLKELAELADQIMDVVTSTPQVAAASSHPGTPESAQIAALTRQVEVLSAKLDRMSRPRQRETSRRRGRSASTRSLSSYKKFPNCWYHNKFGSKAHKCVQPCDYAGKAKGSR